ncbi:MAG: ADOP family duplicated permease [Acidobacteriaceae bacterium]
MSLRILVTRLFARRRRRSDSDIDEELTAHLEMAAAELRDHGMSAEAAEREARLRFGGVTQQREAYRNQARPPLIDSIVADLRYATRQLRRNPAFTTVAVLTLALGIGATTAIYSLVQAVLLRSLPYGHAEQLVYLYMPNVHLDAPPEVMTPSDADFFDIQRMSHSFRSMTAFGQKIFNVCTPNTVTRVSAATVDAQFFSTFEAAPILGRTILQQDNVPGQDHVAIISYKLWHSLFAESTDVLTRAIIFDGSPYRIIGVMPREFEYPTFSDLPYGNASVRTTDIWVPLALTPQQAADRESANLYTVARLKPDVTIAGAQAEMSAIVRQLTSLHKFYSSGWSAKIESLRDNPIGPVRPLLLLLLGAVTCVLFVACGNAANLLLARAAARTHEFGVRATLGAARFRIIRQLLTEALLLSGIAGISGIALAWLFLRLLLRLDPGDIPRLQQASIDPWVLLFAVALVCVTCLLFGTLPAVSASRVRLTAALQSGVSRGVVVARSRRRSLLIVGEVALVVVLLACAGLLLRSYRKVVDVRPGFAASTLTFDVGLDARYSKPEQRRAYFHRLLDAIAAIPGVQNTGAITIAPLSHAGSMTFLWVDGYPHNAPNTLIEDDEPTPDYFTAMGMPLLAGRFFTPADRDNSPKVVIVNASFEKRYFAGQSAIGHRLRAADTQKGPWATVVGVIADVHSQSLEQAPTPQIYSPFWQDDNGSANVATRASLPPDALIDSIQRVARSVDPTVAIADLQTMQQAIAASTVRRRFQTTLVSIFAGVALLLALIGLYGLLAYSVRQRVPEIGVRIALGASRARVIGMVVQQGLRLVMFGLIIGLAAALACVHLLAGMLYGVRTYDPVTFVGAPILLVLAALMACGAPAWHAAHIEPSEALRAE